MTGISPNMPVLWQNCLSMFSTEIGRKAWVWFAEARGTGMLYEADRYAFEVEELVLMLRPCLEAARRRGPVELDDEGLDDLLRFILIRHANWRLGANVRPEFLTGGVQ